MHDLEDSLLTVQIQINDFEKDLHSLFETAVHDYMPDMSQDEAQNALKTLKSLSCWPKEFDRSHRHLASLKDLTSQLIGRFALAAEQETRSHFGDGDLVRYQANLLVPRAQIVEVALLKSMAGFSIIRAEKSQERYAKQQQVITELVDVVLANAPESLESFFLQEWNRANTDKERMRVVIDQVASLTDVGAYALHEKLIGA